jgi:hypothetical protein
MAPLFGSTFPAAIASLTQDEGQGQEAKVTEIAGAADSSTLGLQTLVIKACQGPALKFCFQGLKPTSPPSRNFQQAKER